MREYLLRACFLMVDDFHGEDEWQTFTEGMRTIFPIGASRLSRQTTRFTRWRMRSASAFRCPDGLRPGQACSISSDTRWSGAPQRLARHAGEHDDLKGGGWS